MTKPSTGFGEPISPISAKLIQEVRLRVNQPISPNFNTDYNIYRFILNVERTTKREKDIIEHAAKALNNHLRLRKAFKLDSTPPKSFDENPLFTKHLMPRGEIQTDKWDIHNRLLWYIDYASITVEEEKTRRLSSLRHIIDMSGYEINPFTMLFVTSGTLAYYSQLFHFENYPELVSPSEMVNISRWIHVPYRLARSMMPSGFADRFVLHDHNYMHHLLKEISKWQIPVTLGGTCQTIMCKPAHKVPVEDYWKPKDESLLKELETIHIPASKRKYISIDVKEANKKLSWYFRTEGDIHFGVFYEPPATTSTEGSGQKEGKASEQLDTDHLEMVYPYLKLSAKLVHERDEVLCGNIGRYFIVWCNNHSWMYKRTVDFVVHISDDTGGKRLHYDGSISPACLSF